MLLTSYTLPKPVTLRRKALDQTFAVALMRAGYNAVDALDIVGMDEYQRQFFDVRSRAWERYKRENAAVVQGRLADARYFDFISYAQMCTTRRFVAAPAALFTEAYADADGRFRERVVRRDVARLPTPPDVLRAFRRETGRRIVDALQLAARPDTPFHYVLGAVYLRFEREGYCISAIKSLDDDARACTFELVAPATLWGVTALKRRRGICTDYDVFAGHTLLNDVGLLAEVTTTVTPTSLVRRWRLL